MAVQQSLCVPFGMMSNGTAISTQSLNTTSIYIGYRFIAPSTSPLSAVRGPYIANLGGTGGTNSCKLYPDSNGAPNISSALDTLTIGTLTIHTQFTATGGTYTPTAGTPYWVVINNADGAPGTNFLNLAYIGPLSVVPSTFSRVATSTNGTTWTLNFDSGGMRFDFNDGTHYGSPLANTTNAFNGANQLVYGGREMGAQFVTPANAKMVVAGVGFTLRHSGTPTGNLSFKLYDGSHTLIAQTYSITAGDAIATNNYYDALFSTPQTLSANSTYTVTMANSATDSSANCYWTVGLPWDTDATSLTLIPWSLQQDYYNGTSWTQTAGTLPAFSLLLATGSEFA